MRDSDDLEELQRLCDDLEEMWTYAAASAMGLKEPKQQIVYRAGVYTVEFDDGRELTLTEPEARELYEDLEAVLDP